tara:strand:- start:112 stop:252 length:141 start_codon:yes stop_codon:yes gene_type:complete
MKGKIVLRTCPSFKSMAELQGEEVRKILRKMSFKSISSYFRGEEDE